MGNKKYVTDLIGDEYLEWCTGDKILISTPTGSGKSTFVITSLLKTAVENKKHIAYYCNRKVLNEQFSAQSKLKIEEAFGKDIKVTKEAAKHLHIFTYQGSELRKNYPNVVDVDSDTGEEILIEAEKIMYYIFDEAHYFISDALINDGTNFWYNQKFADGISVFLTATPKPLSSLFAGWDRLTTDGNRVLYEAFKQEDIHNAELKRLEPVFLKRMQWEFKQVNVIPKLPEKGTLAAESIRRKREALKAWYETLTDHFENEKEIKHEYHYQPDYSYIEETYFKDYSELLPEIMKNDDEKWLIFVDDEKVGVVLENTYREKGILAWFLSRSRIMRGGMHKEIYNYIVYGEFLPTRILIATSVLDCGINIKDNMVKNIVVDSDDETTFLQMLGRKRVEDGEKVRLFIKYYSYLKIHNRYYTNLNKLRFSIKFSLKNDLGLIKSGRSTYYRDGNSYGTYLSAHEIKKLPKESLQYKNELLTVSNLEYLDADCNGHIKERIMKGMNYEQIMREFEYSRTAFINIMVHLYGYEKAMSGYRTAKENFSDLCDHFILCGEHLKKIKREDDKERVLLYDPVLVEDRFKKFSLGQIRDTEETIDYRSHMEGFTFFYLEHQLRWIGKKYDVHNWLNYDENFENLLHFLDDLANNSYCLREDANYHEQEAFSRKCLELMQKLPVLPSVIASDASRYVKEVNPQYPRMNKLNKCFQALNIPFRIVSRQIKYEGVDRKKTCWLVKKDLEQSLDISAVD